MGIADRIREYGAAYEQLTRAIQEIGYIDVQIYSQETYFARLTTEVARRQSVLDALAGETREEFKEMQKLKHFTFKRIHATLSGRISEKIAREKADYMRAFETEQNEKVAIEVLHTQMKEAQEVRDRLLKQQVNLNNLMSQLDELLNCIFQGPTPEFPPEDQLEYAADKLQAETSDYKLDLQRYTQAQSIVKSAAASLTTAIGTLQQALKDDAYDALANRTVAEVVENSSLASVRNQTTGAQTLLDQARQLVPEMPFIGELSVAQDNLVMDIMLNDHTSTDMVQGDWRDKLRDSFKVLSLASDQLRGALSWLSDNATALQRAAFTVQQRLDTKRIELSNERRRIFEEVLHSTSEEDAPGLAEDAPPPPPYAPPQGLPIYAPPQGLPMYTPPEGPPPGVVEGEGRNLPLEGPPLPLSPLTA